MFKLTYILMFAVALVVISAVSAVSAQDYATFTVGSIEVVALADTSPDSPPPARRELLVGLSDAERAAVTDEDMRGSINCFVAKMGGDVVLFDTGLGVKHGLLLESLKKAGLTPADITAVFISHFHGDHIGGLVDADGAAVYPAAELFVPTREVEAMPADAAKFIGAYAGRLNLLDWEKVSDYGVTGFDASGHTGGHTVYVVEHAGDAVMVGGDLIHFGGVQLANPDIAVTYDVDPAEAIESRRRIFDFAVEEDLPFASMHLPFPGFGKLSKVGEGYEFGPLE